MLIINNYTVFKDCSPVRRTGMCEVSVTEQVMSDSLGGADLREVVKVLDGHLRADRHSVHLIVEAVQ